MVECTGLENRHGFIARLGFKSLSLRHIQMKPQAEMLGAFSYIQFRPLGFLLFKASYPSAPVFHRESDEGLPEMVALFRIFNSEP